MINIAKVKAYCKDYQNIENFTEAYNDLSETWHCHHKLEIHDDYENTQEDLINMNLYYDRSASELIFLRASEHISLHFRGKKPHPGGKCFKGMKWKLVDEKRVWYVS